MEIKLPENVEYILNKLEMGGFRADIVGGPVRDFLLGKIPDDYDITTSASPEETKKIFSTDRTVDTGIKHGTVSVILDGISYEVTTYRIDGEYRDSRHPESVTFTKNIEEDLRRRDFTMNAIAYSPERGITDPYGGQSDVSLGVIRAVGEPEVRFTEDALRILRGARFSATLGFEVEEETRLAMLKTKELLLNVSVERIYTELKKMISGDYSYEALSTFSDVILTVVPELKDLNLPKRELYEKADYASRLISVFYLNSKEAAYCFDNAMKRLHTDSHIRELGAKVIPLIENTDTASPRGLTYIMRDIGEEFARSLLNVKILLGISSEKDKKQLLELIDSGAPYRISDLNINGSDLISIGAKGKQIGETLDRLLAQVIDGKLKNEKTALVSEANIIISSLKNANLI